jgi:hypothetical protein
MKTVYRFCDANDSTTSLSNAAQQQMSLPSDNWQRKSIRNVEVLKRAAEHMDGKTAMSPFVSVATNVLELVKWGVSGGLLDIVYGVDHPERRAPHIVTFQVPFASIISPDDIKVGIPSAAGLSGILRSRLETELLYYGNDIRRYQTSFRDNPYTNESYQAHLRNEQQTHMQEQQAAEAAADASIAQQQAAQAGQPANLSAKLVRDNPGPFAAAFVPFLAAQTARLAAANIDKAAVAVPNLAATPALALGPKLRRFDDAIRASNDALLVQAWLAVSAPYRV